MMQVPEFTLALVGDSGVGKTALISRLQTDEFSHEHVPTRGVSVRKLCIFTNFGRISFPCWDCGGNETYDGALIPAHGAVVMFDLTSRLSRRNVPRWVSAVRRVRPHIPIVVVGNKVDAPDRFTVTAEQIAAQCGEPLAYMEVSAKYSSSVAEPFVCFARLFMEDENVMIVEPPATNPPHPDVLITAEQIALFEAEMAAAVAAVPLPDEDEDL